MDMNCARRGLSLVLREFPCLRIHQTRVLSAPPAPVRAAVDAREEGVPDEQIAGFARDGSGLARQVLHEGLPIAVDLRA